MSKLEQLVLPFDNCMQLTKRGIIILDCAFCWVMDNDDQQVKLIEASRMMDINDLKGEVVFLSHAPTLSELMDEIVTVCQGDSGPSHLLTLFSVLMEVTL